MNPLVYWRMKRAMTAIELAARSGISAGTISRLQKGRRKGSAATIGKLAAALEIDPAELAALLE